jgi:hypothetical protein
MYVRTRTSSFKSREQRNREPPTPPVSPAIMPNLQPSNTNYSATILVIVLRNLKNRRESKIMLMKTLMTYRLIIKCFLIASIVSAQEYADYGNDYAQDSMYFDYANKQVKPTFLGGG